MKKKERILLDTYGKPIEYKDKFLTISDIKEINDKQTIIKIFFSVDSELIPELLKTVDKEILNYIKHACLSALKKDKYEPEHPVIKRSFQIIDILNSLKTTEKNTDTIQIQCTYCGYNKNSSEDTSCSLCGSILKKIKETDKITLSKTTTDKNNFQEIKTQKIILNTNRQIPNLDNINPYLTGAVGFIIGVIITSCFFLIFHGKSVNLSQNENISSTPIIQSSEPNNENIIPSDQIISNNNQSVSDTNIHPSPNPIKTNLDITSSQPIVSQSHENNISTNISNDGLIPSEESSNFQKNYDINKMNLALEGLKELQSISKTGVSVAEYGNKIINSKFKVDRVLENKKEIPADFYDEINKSISCYQDAYEMLKLEKTSNTKEAFFIEPTSQWYSYYIEKYPEIKEDKTVYMSTNVKPPSLANSIYIPGCINIIWKKCSECIIKSEELLKKYKK